MGSAFGAGTLTVAGEAGCVLAGVDVEAISSVPDGGGFNGATELNKASKLSTAGCIFGASDELAADGISVFLVAPSDSRQA